jgi:hypothetical protein
MEDGCSCPREAILEGECNTHFLHHKIFTKLRVHEFAFLEKISLRKKILKLIWLKVEFMAWHIVFSKNP